MLRRLIATMLVTLAACWPLAAQEPNKDLVPFKATLRGAVPPIGVIPTDPPFLFCSLPMTGTSDLLGQISWIDHHTSQVGVDGVPKTIDGIGVITGANGDALFFKYGGVVRPSSTPGGVIGINFFHVTGGRGRFVSATGSGDIHWVLDPAKKEFTFTLEAMVSRPTAKSQ